MIQRVDTLTIPLYYMSYEPLDTLLSQEIMTKIAEYAKNHELSGC